MPDPAVTGASHHGDPAVISERAGLVCARCGYELRGLRRDANCPECGTPLSQSVYGDYLRHEQPQWLSRLTWGAAVAAAAQAGWLALNGYWLVSRGSYGWRVLLSEGPLLGVTAPVALTLLEVAAILLLTTPRPRHFEPLISSRRVLRSGALLTCAMGLAGYLPAVQERPPPVYWLAFGMLSAGVTLTWGLYLSRLAFRIPNAALASETLLIAVISATVWSLLYVVPLLTHGRTIRAGAGTPAWRRSPMEVVFWCVGLYVLVITARFYRAFAAAGAAAVRASAST
jgi:hypothetical protein